MKPNQIRIIGGIWRSRKITFPNDATLRPTPDRVRETLFNWLTPYIVEANCLDVFAGSGALSFEALSRGAVNVVCLDKNPAAIAALKNNQVLLQSTALEIIEADALTWLQGNGTSFDIVFLDPPYQANLLPDTFALLETQGWLHPRSLIYFESNTALMPNRIPNTWQLLHTKKAGQLHYFLAQKDD